MAKLFIDRNNTWFVYLMIFGGTGILAFTIKCMFDPVGLVTGGFTGVAILLKNMTSMVYEGGIPLWFANLALNVPVFLIALRVKGKRFIARTARLPVCLWA